MLIGFTGATGRTDASHAAILTARAFAASGTRTTFLSDGTRGQVKPAPDGSWVVVDTAIARGGPADALRRARTACRDGVVVADIPPAWLDRNAIHSSVDITVVVVGPHESDECEAVGLAKRLRLRSQAGRPVYLGCRRAGGAPAAAEFLAAMTRVDSEAIALAYAMPPLGRDEASSLMRTPPTGRALGIGFSLASAIGEAAGASPSDRPRPAFADGLDEARRIAASGDTRTFPDRLRDLADDVEAIEAGFGPSAADLAGAPVLDGWDFDAVARPILRGRVSGHPNIVENHRVRTSEVFLTDRRTWARTLSRWYVLRAPAGTPRADLQ